MKVTPVGYQWLDTAHFRKKIPKGANPADWQPVITVAHAEAVTRKIVEAELLRWWLLYGGPSQDDLDHQRIPHVSPGVM